ncbi:MAG: regulatory iron-sulfur-containing complex subunit RicT [Pseudomonadota bacterium]
MVSATPAIFGYNYTMEQELQAEPVKQEKLYKIQFREKGPIFSATSQIHNLKIKEMVMIQTDHNLEPAKVMGLGPLLDEGRKLNTPYTLLRRGSRDEIEKYDRLVEREQEAFTFCQEQIAKQDLSMKLIRVERFFNGSKIIFYFTAENRVDFRQLVKDLVQEFRTRVEMRQIGVRHETKMIGGLGCCGRELCCASYIDNFAPVSIKMAKEQNLPLNPVKISGICNRLLCCLTYEYSTYRDIKKEMPRVGKKLIVDGKSYKVIQQNVLDETVTAVDTESSEPPVTLSREDWEPMSQKGGRPQPPRPRKKQPPKQEKTPKQKKP